VEYFKENSGKSVSSDVFKKKLEEYIHQHNSKEDSEVYLKNIDWDKRLKQTNSTLKILE